MNIKDPRMHISISIHRQSRDKYLWQGFFASYVDVLCLFRLIFAKDFVSFIDQFQLPPTHFDVRTPAKEVVKLHIL